MRTREQQALWGETALQPDEEVSVKSKAIMNSLSWSFVHFGIAKTFSSDSEKSGRGG